MVEHVATGTVTTAAVPYNGIERSVTDASFALTSLAGTGQKAAKHAEIIQSDQSIMIGRIKRWMAASGGGGNTEVAFRRLL